MSDFYCVESYYDANGHLVSCMQGKVSADARPKCTRDVRDGVSFFLDYFPSYQSAQEFIQGTLLQTRHNISDQFS